MELTTANCTNTVRLEYVERDVTALQGLMETAINTQAMVAGLEKQALDQGTYMLTLVESFKATEARVDLLERSSDMQKGEHVGLVKLGRMVIGGAVVMTGLIAVVTWILEGTGK